MIDLDFEIAIPSKGRWNHISTLNLFPPYKSTFLYVPDNEAPFYEVTFPGLNIVPVPQEIHGITATRNFMLDHSTKPFQLHLDDDAIALINIEGGKYHKLPPDSFLKFVQNGFEMSQDLGVHLWGLNVTYDRKFYRTYDPFQFKTIMVATFFGIIITELRFDETIPLKEDYDFSLQHIKRDGKILRFPKYNLRTKHHTNSGGCVDYRTSELEKQAADRMIQKWGTRIIKLRKTWKSAEKAGLKHYDIMVKL